MTSSKFSLLDMPLKMNKIDMYKKYASGKVLLFKITNDNYYLIYGECDYYEDVSRDDFAENLDDLLCDDKIPYYTSVIIIEPISDKMMLKEPLTVSEEYFYSNFFQDHIKEKYEIFKAINSLDRHNVYIYYNDSNKNDTGTITYYGLGNSLGFAYTRIDGKSLNDMTIDDYFCARNNYRLAHNMSDDKDTFSNNAPIIDDIRNWLDMTPYKDFESYMTNRVKGQEEVRIITANFYNYLQRLADGKKINNNVLLIAPSGCGKTETFRAIRDYFKNNIPKLPIAQVDLTTMTEQGYRGKDSDILYKELLAHKETKGVGLVFVDEFDKKIIPSYGSNGINNNRAVQHQILTIIEGIRISDNNADIDTSNTLFIACGAFSFCRDKKAQHIRKLGFGDDFPEDNSDHYDKVSREDIIKAGGIYELIGRFNLIVNYHKLDADTINLIIDSEIQELQDSYYIKFDITQHARQQLHSYANTEYGCRLIKAKLQEAIMPYYIDIICNGNTSSEDEIIMIEQIDKY